MADLPLPEDLIDAAISWSVRLDYNRPTPQARADFERWLQADPLHALAWQRVVTMHGRWSALPSRVVRNTLQVVETLRQQRGPDRRGAIKLLALAGAAVGAGWLTRQHLPWQRLMADTSTGVGECKTVQLADGTQLVLNTDTAVSAELSPGRRLVVLHRGEIQVTTGPDSEAAAAPGGKRPFWVATPFGRLQALGTRFTVRLQERQARVSVREGAVALYPTEGGAGAIVHPGESRWLTMSHAEPAAPDGLDADAWTDGVIAGSNIRLADLLAELARYRPGRIVCDERVADLRVTGLYHLKDTDQVLQFLAQTQPVRVAYRTRLWVTVGPLPG